MDESPGLDLARRVAALLAALPGVEAVALGGSSASGRADARSDVDLYVYAAEAPSLDARRRLAAEAGAVAGAEIGNAFFEPGDEWEDAATGIGVDVMYRSPAWIGDRLAAVLDRHEAGLGYTTCLWHNVLASEPLEDRGGWYAALRRRADVPYPEALAAAIVARNRPLLRDSRSSFLHQIEAAAHRGDLVAASHRAAAFLASYFDVLFALNRRPHPGEKRLLDHAAAPGMRTPPGMAAGVAALLTGIDPVPACHELVDGLEGLIAAG